MKVWPFIKIRDTARFPDLIQGARWTVWFVITLQQMPNWLSRRKNTKNMIVRYIHNFYIPSILSASCKSWYLKKTPPVQCVEYIMALMVFLRHAHTPYSWNIMCQKWEGDCGLWDLHEMIRKMYTESLKKIVGAVWELPAK